MKEMTEKMRRNGKILFSRPGKVNLGFVKA
jgi:hypothetical protein